MAESSKILRALDGILHPLGFVRRGATWNRVSTPWVDVINVQVDKFGQDFAINLGVADPGIYERCWRRPLPDWVAESQCTVRARLSVLATGLDRWWGLVDAAALTDVSDLLATHGLAFLQSMHSPERMADFLGGRVRGLIASEFVCLVLLLDRVGRRREACDTIRDHGGRIVGPWAANIAELAAALNCEH